MVAPRLSFRAGGGGAGIEQREIGHSFRCLMKYPERHVSECQRFHRWPHGIRQRKDHFCDCIQSVKLVYNVAAEKAQVGKSVLGKTVSKT